MQPQEWNNLQDRLARSSFRSRFRLDEVDCDYLRTKGRAAIARHARDFTLDRLAAARPRSDGRQTPLTGHPVFVAQHATATCCRGCLAKWHKIAARREMTEVQVNYVVAVILSWLDEQLTSRGENWTPPMAPLWQGTQASA